MIRTAKFSPCRNYRYLLERTWLPEKPRLLVVGLNPSTADENFDDNTIRRCIGFAQLWGYGGLWMANAFAYRATKPADMKKHAHPITAPEDPCGNDRALLYHSHAAALTVVAWGTHGKHLNRDREVMKLLINPQCFRLTKEGLPEHPLYMPANTQIYPYSGRDIAEEPHLTRCPCLGQPYIERTGTQLSNRVVCPKCGRRATCGDTATAAAMAWRQQEFGEV